MKKWKIKWILGILFSTFLIISVGINIYLVLNNNKVEFKKTEEINNNQDKPNNDIKEDQKDQVKKEGEEKQETQIEQTINDLVNEKETEEKIEENNDFIDYVNLQEEESKEENTEINTPEEEINIGDKEEEIEEQKEKEKTIENINFKDLISKDRFKNIKYERKATIKTKEVNSLDITNYLSENINGSTSPLNASSLIITKKIKLNTIFEEDVNIRKIRLLGMKESYINGCYEKAEISNNITASLISNNVNIKNISEPSGYNSVASYSSGSCPQLPVYKFAHKSYLEDRTINFKENTVSKKNNLEIEINYPISISFNKYQSQGINKAGLEHNDNNIKIQIEYIEIPKSIKISDHKIVNNGTGMEIKIEENNKLIISQIIDIKKGISEMIRISKLRNLKIPMYDTLKYKILEHDISTKFIEEENFYNIELEWIKIEWEMNFSD